MTLTDHQWPSDQEQHIWGKWYSEKGPPNPTQYRTCIHPDCTEVERRKHPTAPQDS